MPDKTTFKIFVASSNELKEEREKCILLINQLNKSHKHLHLEPVEWEIDMVHSNYPEHETIQDAINPKLQESHLVVFIFFSKIGKYTREEFEFAAKENKRLFAFFKTGFSPDVNELESYGELLKFKKGLNDTVLYKEYDDLDNFEKLFYPNLNLYLVENHPTNVNESDRESVTALSQSNQQLIQLLSAKEEEIKALKENTNQLTDAALKNHINELLQEKEAIRSELLQSEEIKHQLAKDKEELEKQLAPQIEHDNLKAKALEELENGNYPEAEKYLMQSAETSIKETASTFFELAKIKKLQLQYSEALHYYELAVKIGPANSLYLNNAGDMLNTMGFYNKSIEYQENALLLDIKNYGEDHPNIASCYLSIGLAYRKKGEYNKAIEYNEMALSIGIKNHGEKNDTVATCYNNIGLIYCIKGEYNKAIQFHEKALRIDKEIFGENNPGIATDYNNIGTAYTYKKEYDKAIGYIKKALAINKKIYGEVHPDISIRYNNIGNIYNLKGEYDKAIIYLEKSLAIDEKIYGEKHPNIAIRYNNLGGVYNYKGQYDRALTYYENALAIDINFNGEEHPTIATRYNNLGGVYNHKGEYIKALEFFHKALNILLKFLPENHPNIQTTRRNIEITKEEQKKSRKS